MASAQMGLGQLQFAVPWDIYDESSLTSDEAWEELAQANPLGELLPQKTLRKQPWQS
jgi:hypothetical protein